MMISMAQFVTTKKTRSAGHLGRREPAAGGYDALGRRVWSDEELAIIARLTEEAPFFFASNAPRL